VLDFVRRLLSSPTRRRALDAGAAGRRWPNGSRVSNLNADILGTGRTIRERASYYARNNSHAAGAVTALVANIIGSGIVPSPQHPDPAERARLSDAFARWIDEADFDGAADFFGLQALACRSWIENGESFGHLLLDDDALRLRLIHPSQIPTEWPSASLDNSVRGGFVFDEVGRKIGVLALPFRPDDPMAAYTGTWNPVRLPIDEVVHVFEALEPGQIRGLSWFAPVLLAIKELDELQDAALVRAKIGNLLCAALIDANGDAAGLPGQQDGGGARCEHGAGDDPAAPARHEY